MRSLILAAALGLLVLASPVPGGFAADQKEAAARELERVQSESRQLKRELAERAAERGSATEALREAELAEKRARAAVATTRREASAAEARRAESEKRVTQAVADLGQHRGALAEQLRAAHMNAGQERLRLLLTRADAVGLTRRMVYYGYVSRQRAELLAALSTKLEELKAELEAIAVEAGRLTQLAAEQRARLDELGRSRKARAQALAALDRQLGQRDARLKALEAEAKELRAVVARVAVNMSRPEQERRPAPAGGSFAKRRKQLGWPAEGPVLGEFGKLRAGGPLRWDGLLVAAPAGADVRAVHDGRVVYADWLPGLGLLLILDHGDGYLSLYGHNQDLLPEPGARVNAGEVVAHVGDSGGQSRAGLYFEIRRNGKPVNPREWLR